MKLSSPAFSHQGKIPSKYTCDGTNVNPPLSISDVPHSAKSLVLIMDDPDVPPSVRKDRMWDHCIVFNIPPTVHTIPENTPPPGITGTGTSGHNLYDGPCPPDREHRYFFKLYALDCTLDLTEVASKKDVEQSMAGHIISQVELIGRYERT
jgi:Raf kinase inhibitor-like YbhB/YbcL family protein